jgi:PAS domain S-box-containing protein
VVNDPSPPPLDAVLYRSWPLPDGQGIRLEYLSDGAEALLELPADELARRINTGTAPLYGVDEAAFYQSAVESLTHHTPWRAEFGYVGPKTGRRRWLRAADFPHRTADGVPYFVGVMTDLTAIKEAEAAAAAAYARLDAHLDNVPLAVVEWDERFRVKRWSPQAEGLFGWAAEEMVGRHPDEVAWVHPADRGRVDRAIAGMRSGVERKTILIHRNLTETGRELLVEWHHSVLFGADGRAESFLSFARDMTAQFAVERELMLADERLRTALRATNMLVWDVDRGSPEAYYSDHCGEFHGLSEAGAAPTAEQARLMVHPDDRERVRAEIEAAVTRDEAYQIEYRGAAADADGQPRWFVSNGRPVLNAAGEWVRRMGVVTDITARKRAEAERAELDRQLTEVRRYESLGVLAGGIAHDFNNLLTVIMGNAAVLRSRAGAGTGGLGGGGPPEQVDRPLTDIEEACKRAAHLCSQMTAYAGVGRMAVGPVDAAGLLRQLEPTLRADAGNVRLSVTAPADLPPLVGEPFQVRQAVRNLVTNAGEATPAGGWVKVEADRRTIGGGESGAYALAPPPGEYVMIRVSDSGSGMTGEVKAKAFDPFFSTKFAGRGLGLAAVLGIVRGHRGGVRVASAVGRGTLIELYFPLSNTPAERSLLPPSSGTFPAPTRPAPAAIPPSAAQPGDRGAVLVCDDELNIRELIATVLEGDGFRVVRARDGVEGVAAFAREPAGFVLAVVDLLMPGLGGHEVVRRVRQLRPALPAVLVSGFADRELPADVRASGPTTLLPKPFRLEHLSAVVGQLLRGSGVSEA